MIQNKLTDDDFFSKYTCEYNRVMQSKLAEQEDNGRTTIEDMAPYNGCMYETYDEEYQRVKEMVAQNPKRVWTIINCDGWEGIVAGWHWINRTGYLITEQEWSSEEEEYTCYDNSELREQWDSLPAEAIEEVTSIKVTGEDDLEEVKDEEFYQWEELDEEYREEIMNRYTTKD